MPLKSINPYTTEVNAEIDEHTDAEVEAKLSLAAETYISWRKTSFAERGRLFLRLADLLDAKKQELGELLTREMGKTVGSSIAEIEKSALTIRMYAGEAEKMLAPEQIETEFSKSYVRFDPLGVILAVMPWNFPFWQVLRFAAPGLMGGNVAVLKHASSVPLSAMKLEELFLEAGFPAGAFQTLLIGSARVEGIIRDRRISAVTLTGSESAGRQVGRVAGEELKPAVLELGGSDAFIVLADADVKEVARKAVDARLVNNGQSCIAAKRFIIADEIYDEFVLEFGRLISEVESGDPMLATTQLGPLASLQAHQDLSNQVDSALESGAKILAQSKKPDAAGSKGYFYPATLLGEVDAENPVYLQELFGPVAVVYRAKDDEEIIKIANATDYGLGGSIWTKNTDHAEALIPEIVTGSVYVNKIMTSHPKMPFGGVKSSGYGRELSAMGIKEFQNAKSVIVA